MPPRKELLPPRKRKTTDFVRTASRLKRFARFFETAHNG